MTKQIRTMCTAFRDGFQSVFGARVLSSDFIPVVEAASNAGIKYFESGGGAMFQSPFFYCQENAFDVMDAFRKAAGPDAELQTLARGVNVVGLESQPSDIIDLHARLFKKHGVSSIRNFDALNDIENLRFSGESIVKAGLNHQAVITMMALPPGTSGAHDTAFYIGKLREFLESGIPFNSICFKDASGTSTPAVVYETVKEAKRLLSKDISVHFHTHETAGVSVLAYKAALDGGADCIDLSLAPVSGGTCQPDYLTMWHALRGSEYELDVDIAKISEVERFFKDSFSRYDLLPEASAVEPLIPWSPMPGGALTANTQMMRDAGCLDRFPEVIANMGEVVQRGGFGTSVTPVSQFYFQQAYNNMYFGPWKKIADGYGKMVLGYFGKTPTAPDPEIVAIASEQLNLEPTTKKVLEINDADKSRGVDATKALLNENNLPVNDENIFIAATCREKGVAFLSGKGEFAVRLKSEKGEAVEGTSSSGEYTVSVNGRSYSVAILDGGKTEVDGVVYETSIKDGVVAKDASSDGSSGGESVAAPMPGKVFKISVNVGDSVSEGDTLLVLEAMKMENDVVSPCSGTVSSIKTTIGAQVSPGDILIEIS